MDTTYRVARLPARLRGFALPDTSTSPEGYVEAGDYLVLEEKARHPTPDWWFGFWEWRHVWLRKCYWPTST
ncbi:MULTISPECIES: hypothetical protein [Myxococcus]|uniref:hypothetical protein n=1 Tax=Myxococcus TaxID=32 RepID=UPI00129C78AF|nr:MULTISPECIES: hypothetical protein [Myxococcus]NOK04666.1 hypothetical protein [Myxococcus xanthus]